jgi:hypothetical protein
MVFPATVTVTGFELGRRQKPVGRPSPECCVSSRFRRERNRLNGVRLEIAALLGNQHRDGLVLLEPGGRGASELPIHGDRARPRTLRAGAGRCSCTGPLLTTEQKLERDILRKAAAPC